MIILGIESTAHTFGIGIIKATKSKCTILANVRANFTTEEGGMIPSKVAQHHIDVSDKTLQEALSTAKINLKKIDLIAYSQSPGIGHCLRIGAVFARTLAQKLKKPIIGVNHCIAHLEIGRIMTKAKDPVLLYVSGANTQIIAYEGKRYRIIGETLDGGIGNFLDSFARELKLGFPGGPKIEALAKKSKNYIELPYAVKGMDLTFSGILTQLKRKNAEGTYTKEDLCYSAQETVFAMVIEVAERAMAHCNKKELLLGGGVACNKQLQRMAQKMCKERNAKCYMVENQLNVDNGVMIAWLGFEMYRIKKRGTPLSKADIQPYVRTDEVKVFWR
ncbi:MAG: bifunctional N(6)-L-threonylcarbamoyladenine synthase/serine/threonine protein kinase [Candidatus Woesearchaeota archaeon]